MYTLENDSQFEFLSLIVNYPNLIEKTYIKEEFLENKNQILFSIIIKEYEKSNCLVIENLTKYKNFDLNYYLELLKGNLYNSFKETAFIQLQKNIIDKYKEEESRRLIEQYDGNYENLINQLTKLNDIDYNEVEYINAQDMYKEINTISRKVKTGFYNLDRILNISEHDLIILAGATGGGKTTFALNLLNNMSKEYQCYYFNMEMSKNILYKRLISMNTKIQMKDLNDISSLGLESKKNIKSSLYDIEKRKIVLLNKSFTINEIRKQVANIKNDKHTIIFLDHIGLIKSSGNSLYEKMTNVAKELRSICLDYNCTIIGLCQLSRESQRNNDVPKLQDLRDSGEIEQSARKVIMLYNTTIDNTERVHDIELIVAKNDDGTKTKVKFDFDRYIQTFKEKTI